MKKYIPSLIKAGVIFLVSILCLVGITELAYNRIENEKAMNNHAIIFFYRVNVLGGYVDQWQHELRQQHPDIDHLEVQRFDLIESGGNSPSGMPSSLSGWQIISTRMGAGECDILIVNLERYEFMLKKGWLLELDYEFDQSRRMLSNGTVMGYDIQGMQLSGLEFPCGVEPHNRLESTDTASNEVVLCLLKTASPQAIELAGELLSGAVKLPEPEDIKGQN